MKSKYQMGIGLLGKGSTNHLHLNSIVESLSANDIEPTFIVREDYADLLEKLPSCNYVTVSFDPPPATVKTILAFTTLIRKMHPSNDPGRSVDVPELKNISLMGKIPFIFARFLAMFRVFAHLAVWIEGKLFNPAWVKGLNSNDFDQLLLLGVGTVNSELEGQITLWAQSSGLSIVHYIGNYDNLSSKGFRGIDPSCLLVWGPSMKDDAEKLQHIAADIITVVGSLRYNDTIFLSVSVSRDKFLKSVGLDPNKKTIMYAGFVLEHSYFEMLEAYKELIRERTDCQLIMRLYPNKDFMNSVYISAIIGYTATLPGTFVSLADPYYKRGDREKEVLQIEEYELVNSLSSCDVVVNQFSTISIEACLYDKPVINMWYFPKPNRAMRTVPLPFDYQLLYHNRRMESYHAVPVAENRGRLVALLNEALDHPELRREERQRVLNNEIGVVDGKAFDRLVAASIHEYKRFYGKVK